MQPETQILIVTAVVFGAVFSLIAVIGLRLENRRRIQARLVGGESASVDVEDFTTTITERLDETVLAFRDAESRSRLRGELIKAGFFSPSAPAIYFAAQVFLTVAAPIFGYLCVTFFAPSTSFGLEAFILSIMAYAGYKGPEALIKRRQTSLAITYRIVFPDFLDLLVVCIDAGLGMNSALDRVTTEFTGQCKPLADNLSIFLSEIRSGRAFPDALQNLSDRLGIEEARSFSTLIKQSLELGSDIGTALRVYSDEMRTKRLLRAELTANSLPIKMLIPLGLFIFPVILITVLTPALVSLTKLFSELSRG